MSSFPRADAGSPRRAVVVGSGSAGRRHLAALRTALPAVDLVLVRRPDSAGPADPASFQGAALVASVADACRLEPDIAVVAGPAPFHADAVEQLLAAGADVLVEKPVAATVADALRIDAATRRSSGRVVVGYHLRFADVVPALADLIRQGAIGRPTGFELGVGQHLSQWRAGVDPRDSVTARADLGGGVLLELSHEIDGLRFLLGDVDSVGATLDHGGAPTDGIVDTVADLDLVTADGVAGTVHLDMTSDIPFRRWTVRGERGTLDADLLAGRLVHATPDGESLGDDVRSWPAGERDRAEQRLVAHLLDVHAGRAAPACTTADGVAALRIVEAARAAAARTPGDLVAVGS